MTSDRHTQNTPLDTKSSDSDKIDSGLLRDLFDNSDVPWLPPGQASLNLNLFQDDDSIDIDDLLISVSQSTLRAKAFAFDDSELPIQDPPKLSNKADNSKLGTRDSRQPELNDGDKAPDKTPDASQRGNGEDAEKTPEKPQDPSQKANEVSTATPIQKRQFEGTNEIFVQSSVFDSMLEEEENTKKHGGNKISIDENFKLSRDGHNNFKKVDDNNVVGIVSSGILPNIEVDKSFDMPCIDENSNEFASISIPKDDLVGIDTELADSKRSQSEVFVSRISQHGEQPKIERASQENIQPAPKASIRMFPEKAYGLPLPETPGAIHPDDNGAISQNSQSLRFALEHAYRAKVCDLLGQDVEDTGLDNDIQLLMAALAETNEAEHPKAVQLQSECRLPSIVWCVHLSRNVPMNFRIFIAIRRLCHPSSIILTSRPHSYLAGLGVSLQILRISGKKSSTGASMKSSISLFDSGDWIFWPRGMTCLTSFHRQKKCQGSNPGLPSISSICSSILLNAMRPGRLSSSSLPKIIRLNATHGVMWCASSSSSPSRMSSFSSIRAISPISFQRMTPLYVVRWMPWTARLLSNAYGLHAAFRQTCCRQS